LDKASPRQIRQLNFFSQFSAEINHISGKSNSVAYALSRIESISMPIIVSLQELADYQKDDEELQVLLTSNSSLQLKKFILSGSTVPIYCDRSSALIHPYVSKLLRKRIFDVVH